MFVRRDWKGRIKGGRKQGGRQGKRQVCVGEIREEESPEGFGRVFERGQGEKGGCVLGKITWRIKGKEGLQTET